MPPSAVATSNDTNLEQLRNALRAQRVLVVIGAGLTAASSPSSVASSWRQLIENGVEYYLSHQAGASQDIADSIALDLEVTGLSSAFTSAAEKLTEALGGTSSAFFANWLRESVGSISTEDDSLVTALLRLQAPLSTVNYDMLIEAASARVPRTWLEAEEMQAALIGQTSDIAHLHGVWTQPNSVVFGSQSYGRLIGNASAIGLERAIGASRSMLFVGCGAGIDDPNFASLREWLTNTFRESRLHHFRLCTNSELDELRRIHINEKIVPISYGDSHSDLPAFLTQLAIETTLDSRPPVVRAVAHIEEQLRNDFVFCQQITDLDARSVDQLIRPPVVLPVSPEQFVAANRDKDGPKLHRSDLEMDLRQERVLLLVGDESSGLTTALHWLVHEKCVGDAGTIPLLLDFRSLVGARPIDRSVRRELRDALISVSPSDSLPALALAFDGVVPSSTQAFSRFADELTGLDDASLIVLGCRTGSEASLERELADRGMRVAVRYMGRLSSDDIESLAKLVAPDQASRLTARALEVIQREHLARTPLTVCLLLSVLLAGESLLATASETALLDAYVQLLLGRGTALDDARIALDAHELSSMLARLAQAFVLDDSGAMDESAVIQIFEQYFETKGWDESASDTLALLKRRHVLARKHGKIGFSQSSFLHLFAAKRAIRERSLWRRLLETPTYYSEILKHYAALTRDDEELLRAIGDFLEGEVGSPEVTSLPRSHSLSHQTVVADGDNDSMQKLLVRLDAPILRAPEEQPEGDVLPARVDSVESVYEADIVPFPVVDLAAAPAPVRIMEILSLVSNIVRDSEEVENLQLKQSVLASVLSLWGRLVDALEADSEYMEFVRHLADGLIDHLIALDDPENERPAFIEGFMELAPLLTSYGVMTLTLSSRKLFLMLLKVFRDASSTADPGLVVLGAMLGADLQQAGWSELFETAERTQGRVAAVQTVLVSMALYAFYNDPQTDQDSHALKQFVAGRLALKQGEEGTERWVRSRDQIAQRLQRNKLTGSGRVIDADEGNDG